MLLIIFDLLKSIRCGTIICIALLNGKLVATQNVFKIKS